MKMRNTAGILRVIGAICFLMACATAPEKKQTPPEVATNTPAMSTASQSQPVKTTDPLITALKEIAENNPNDATAQYELGLRYETKGRDYVQAAAAYEKALAIEPNYGYGNRRRFIWVPNAAATTLGVDVTEDLIIEEFSLFFDLGRVYYNAPRVTSGNALEKSLAAFRRGYEIDIESGKNTNTNLKTVYLAYIAKVLDSLNRTDEMVAIYKELAKVAALTPEIAARFKLPEWCNRVPEFAGLSLEQLRSKFPGKMVEVVEREPYKNVNVYPSFPTDSSFSIFTVDSSNQTTYWHVYFTNTSLHQQFLETFTGAYGEPILIDDAKKSYVFRSGMPKGVSRLYLSIEQDGKARAVRVSWDYHFDQWDSLRDSLLDLRKAESDLLDTMNSPGKQSGAQEKPAGN